MMKPIEIDPKLCSWLSEIRHEFHKHPEIAFQEHWTTKRIRELLSEIGLELLEDDSGKTGGFAILQGNKPGKTIAVRADIDALPIEEETGLAYSSKNKGVMHACGHDAHITIAIGAAKILSDLYRTRDFPGNIKFIFQPAEETLSGAREMIDRGALGSPKVDAIISCHVINGLDIGQVDTFEGSVFAAADQFELVIEGKGGHAGYPHRTSDPLLAGCDFIQGCKSLVHRYVNPVDTCVISTATFNGGKVSNVIPNQAVLTGTIRTYDVSVRNRIIDQMGQLLESIELNHDVATTMNLRQATPALINNHEICQLLTKSAEKLLDKNSIIKTKPRTGSEDFAWYLEDTPGAMFFVGSKKKSESQVTAAHSSTFIIDDDALPVAVGIMVETCREYINQENENS